jgi:hypothetical protein
VFARAFAQRFDVSQKWFVSHSRDSFDLSCMNWKTGYYKSRKAPGK